MYGSLPHLIPNSAALHVFTFICVFLLTLCAFMPPLIIASICIMQLNSRIPLIFCGNLGVWQTKFKIFVLILWFSFYADKWSVGKTSLFSYLFKKFYPLHFALKAKNLSNLTMNGRILCVCLSFDYLNHCSSDRIHTWQVYCWGPKEVQCWMISCLDEGFSRKLQTATPGAKQSGTALVKNKNRESWKTWNFFFAHWGANSQRMDCGRW